MTITLIGTDKKRTHRATYEPSPRSVLEAEILSEVTVCDDFDLATNLQESAASTVSFNFPRDTVKFFPLSSTSCTKK